MEGDIEMGNGGRRSDIVPYISVVVTASFFFNLTFAIYTKSIFLKRF